MIEDSTALDRVFTALASRRRRHIVHSLSLRPASIGQLAHLQRLSLPAIHRHVRVLEQARLVERKKRGRVNFLALERSGLLLMQDWARQFHAYWGSGRETLENYIAGMERDANRLTKRKRGGK